MINDRQQAKYVLNADAKKRTSQVLAFVWDYDLSFCTPWFDWNIKDIHKQENKNNCNDLNFPYIFLLLLKNIYFESK